MKRERKKNHGVITWLNDAELATVQKLTGGTGADKPSSEWLRHFLLEASTRRASELVLMGETLALRALVVNLLDHLVTGKPITAATVGALMKYADADKLDKARRALTAAESM